MIDLRLRSQRHAPYRARRLALVSLWAAAVAAVVVQTSAEAEEIPGAFNAVRPMGMGDAFTGIANDENSVWTNPAGIGRSRKARSRSTFNVSKFPNVIAGANSNGRKFYTAFKGAPNKNVEAVLSQSNDISGKPLWVRGGLFPVTIFDIDRETPMAVGLYSNTSVQALVTKDTPNVAQVTAISDAGAVIDLGFTSSDNRLNAGLQVRPMLRYAFEDLIPSNDLLSKTLMRRHLQEDANKLTGLGLDAGLLYTFADFWFPTLGMSVLNLPTGCKSNYLNPYTQKPENVCGNLFHGAISNANALSTVDPTDVRVGIAITPRLSHSVNMRVAIDAHHIPIGTAAQSYGLQGISATKLLHAGAELFYGNPLIVAPLAARFGVNQGFITYGVTLNVSGIDLEFASYGVDVSSTSKASEDRRYLASLSLDL